jgi:hypothetical protein
MRSPAVIRAELAQLVQMLLNLRQRVSSFGTDNAHLMRLQIGVLSGELKVTDIDLDDIDETRVVEHAIAWVEGTEKDAPSVEWMESPWLF